MDKKILKLLDKLADKYPAQRFGQLLFNYTQIGTRIEGGVNDPFHYQDKDFVKYLEAYLK